MSKTLLTLTLIFQIVILNAQKAQSELIIGTWRFELKCDFRTEEEKSKYLEPKITPIVTENGTGYADRTFKIDSEFEFYYNLNHSDYGKYTIENNKLIIVRRLSKEKEENKKKAVEWSVERNLLKKNDDGFYYFNSMELDLKALSETQMEIGTEKQYTIWKRIK